ncbi:AraC family transcriptional regulator [Bacteroides sp. 51]|uniref:helix-turn-helix domain-containing protein n=1 Tax=Bacteroides sp. 51 TaxID=2302938 RepID=UPI0013D8B6C8|nr:helix-turn-helix domain-containing protein [Bacteroides sp. 51]NDV83136.1 AraC family transcriptional regulator [Bacteroides sp. 51]
MKEALKIGFFFSCTATSLNTVEKMFPGNLITYMIEGQLKFSDPDSAYYLQAGDTVFIKRNDLLRFSKLASKEQPHKSIGIYFPQSFLQEYYSQHQPVYDSSFKLNNRLIMKSPLWDDFFEPLKSYWGKDNDLQHQIVIIKQTEALAILRSLNPGIDTILSNFDKPGKIDLEEFMNKNYKFNLPLNRYAYLTGRSLATFKRDFSKIFASSPQRWLTLKRLEYAHFLISEKGLRPSDVYVDSGFENLSHFSNAFKKRFGYNPSQIKN